MANSHLRTPLHDIHFTDDDVQNIWSWTPSSVEAEEEGKPFLFYDKKKGKVICVYFADCQDYAVELAHESGSLDGYWRDIGEVTRLELTEFFTTNFDRSMYAGKEGCSPTQSPDYDVDNVPLWIKKEFENTTYIFDKFLYDLRDIEIHELTNPWLSFCACYNAHMKMLADSATCKADCDEIQKVASKPNVVHEHTLDISEGRYLTCTMALTGYLGYRNGLIIDRFTATFPDDTIAVICVIGGNEKAKIEAKLWRYGVDLCTIGQNVNDRLDNELNGDYHFFVDGKLYGDDNRHEYRLIVRMKPQEVAG